MINETTSKIYDLEERTFLFAFQVRSLVKCLPKQISNYEDGKQLIRSSGSVGANYIEANDSIGENDKLMRIRICKKEAKESKFWLRLIDINGNEKLEQERQKMLEEAHQLMLIFGSILKKLTNK